MEATKTSSTLSVHRDFSVAMGEEIRVKGSRSRMGPRSLSPLVSSNKDDGGHRLGRQGTNGFAPAHGGSRSVDQGRRLAHQAAPLAHQAAPAPAHQAAPAPAHQAAPLSQQPQPPAHQDELSVAPEKVSARPLLVASEVSQVEQIQPKSPRVVFLPKSLRQGNLWRAGTAVHGWLESPDLASRADRDPESARVHEVNCRQDRVNTGNAASIEWLDEVPWETQGDAALARARARNVKRLREATVNDCLILSKYMPSEISVFFPFGIVGPDDYYQPSQGWVKEVLSVARTVCTVPKPPHIRLGVGQDDLDHNTRFLADCDWDLGEVFRRHVGTTVDHGSEFRPVEQLCRIVGKHPGFAYLKEMLTSGFDYHLTRELTEHERALELKAQLGRGNHRSALENMDDIRSLLSGDVRRGFVLPFRATAILNVKRLHLQPGGMVRQLSLKADGSRQPKSRFTHDLSFSITAPDASVNARVDMAKHPEMVYGWCLLRVIHYLAALRVRHPKEMSENMKFE